MSFNDFLTGNEDGSSEPDTAAIATQDTQPATFEKFSEAITVAMEHLSDFKAKMLAFVDMNDIHREMISCGAVNKRMATEANSVYADKLLTGHLSAMSFTMMPSETNFATLAARMSGCLATESAALVQQSDTLFTKILIDARCALETANEDYYPQLKKTFESFLAECPASSWTSFRTIPNFKNNMAIIGPLRFTELSLYQLSENGGAARSHLYRYSYFIKTLGWKHVRILLWMAAHGYTFKDLEKKENYAEAINYEPTIGEFCDCIASSGMVTLISKTLPDRAFEVLSVFDNTGLIRVSPDKSEDVQSEVIVRTTGAIHAALHQAKEVLAMAYYANMLLLQSREFYEIMKEYDV